MKHPELLDIYSDYLISSFGLTTAVGLSLLLDKGYSHDQISRFLAQKQLSQKDYWKTIKKYIRPIENEKEGILVIDDTIEEKPHSTENDIICYHFDHSKGRSLKGINILNFLYTAPISEKECVSIPVSYEIIAKTEKYIDPKNGKEKRRSPITKNEMVVNRLRILTHINKVKYKYVSWDSWFSSKDNLKMVHYELNKYFVSAVKDNRSVSLTESERKKGIYHNIKNLDLQSNQPMTVWFKGLDFPVQIIKQVFTNKDGSSGELHIITNDLSLSYTQITTIYKKRWNVEVFHKSLKNNASLAKSPTKYETTQSNHIFAAMIAFCKLEALKLKEGLNHFALKSKLYIKALKAAFTELQELKKANGIPTMA
jgi:hypothetical protein